MIRCRRYFSLLEVIIAFFIVSICAIPLLAPNIWMIEGERRFTFEIEAGHIANLLSLNFLEKLYYNQFSWEELNDIAVHPIPPALWEGIRPMSGWPYTGTYSFQIEKSKPGQDNSQSFHLFFLNLFLLPNDTKEKKLHFKYEIFVERKLKSTEVKPSSLEEPATDETPAEED